VMPTSPHPAMARITAQTKRNLMNLTIYSTAGYSTAG